MGSKKNQVMSSKPRQTPLLFALNVNNIFSRRMTSEDEIFEFLCCIFFHNLELLKIPNFCFLDQQHQNRRTQVDKSNSIRKIFGGRFKMFKTTNGESVSHDPLLSLLFENCE